MYNVKVTVQVSNRQTGEKEARTFEHQSASMNFFWAIVQHLRGWNMKENEPMMPPPQRAGQHAEPRIRQ
jgi:hypothetical protein